MGAKEDLMNGAAPAPDVKPADTQIVRADPNLVMMAERILADVKACKITSMVVIHCNPLGHVQWPAHGLQAAELYLGAGCFMSSIIGMVTGAVRKGSRIIHPADAPQGPQLNG